jgi:glyoxylase-like metal-dependent hydrolase (beta-lactamase superfamily II)
MRNTKRLPGFGSDATASLFSEHGLDAQGAAGISARGNSYRKIVGEPPERFVRMLDGEEVNIGSNSWRVIVGYGHAPEHAALYCKSLGVLISGDMLLPKISTNISVWPNKPESDPLRLFLRSIDRFSELPADTLVLPSHGLPFRGGRHRVQMLHDHHRDRLAEVLDACSQPRSRSESAALCCSGGTLDTHQTFFAMGESIAHLNYLWLKGKLSRALEADGVYRFVRQTGMKVGGTRIAASGATQAASPSSTRRGCLSNSTPCVCPAVTKSRMQSARCRCAARRLSEQRPLMALRWRCRPMRRISISNSRRNRSEKRGRLR